MIRVFNYIEQLIHVDSDTFATILEQLSDELSKNQPYPFDFFVQASIRNVVKPFVSESARDERLQRLIDFNLTEVAEESCERVSTLLPSPIENIEAHIFPAFNKGGGCTIAPGKVFVSVKIDEFTPVRLQRNGLAMVFAETLYPARIEPYELSDADEDAWWNEAKLGVVGGDGYVNYIGQRAYEIGSRIVRSYIQSRDISIEQAHYLTDHELYWNSGYEKIT